MRKNKKTLVKIITLHFLLQVLAKHRRIFLGTLQISRTGVAHLNRHIKKMLFNNYQYCVESKSHVGY